MTEVLLFHHAHGLTDGVRAFADELRAAGLALRERQRPRALSDGECERLLALGADLGRVWAAPTTTDRDRKQLLRCLIEEVTIDPTSKRAAQP